MNDNLERCGPFRWFSLQPGWVKKKRILSISASSSSATRFPFLISILLLSLHFLYFLFFLFLFLFFLLSFLSFLFFLLFYLFHPLPPLLLRLFSWLSYFLINKRTRELLTIIRQYQMKNGVQMLLHHLLHSSSNAPPPSGEIGSRNQLSDKYSKFPFIGFHSPLFLLLSPFFCLICLAVANTWIYQSRESCRNIKYSYRVSIVHFDWSFWSIFLVDHFNWPFRWIWSRNLSYTVEFLAIGLHIQMIEKP